MPMKVLSDMLTEKLRRREHLNQDTYNTEDFFFLVQYLH